VIDEEWNGIYVVSPAYPILAYKDFSTPYLSNIVATHGMRFILKNILVIESWET